MYIREIMQPVQRTIEDISLINESVRKGYGLDFHGKESCGAIGNIKLICKSTLVPEKKARDTKRKHETNYNEIEDYTPVPTLDASDDEVNRRMKTMTTTITKTKKNIQQRRGRVRPQRWEENKRRRRRQQRPRRKSIILDEFQRRGGGILGGGPRRDDRRGISPMPIWEEEDHQREYNDD